MATAANDGEDVKKGVYVAAQVSFTELCGLLEKISKTQGNDKKKRVLRDFVEKWREFHKEIHGDNTDTADSFYPVMRLLLPHLEKERIAYGIKEHMLAKLMIEVLCLGKDSPDATRLLNYKAPKTARADAGDFASVAYFVLKNRCPERGTLTIFEVNTCLDNIAVNNAAKKKDLVRKNILHLLKNLSALEQKWLIRMIVKELKVGLSQASVFSVYHADAEEFYNVNNNMEKVCRLLRDKSVRIHEIGISIFSPFTPMLGERASPDKVENLMENKMYYIETKFDGERMLLHKRDDEYRYFSRSGNEYTNTFGATPFDGSLTPYIANCFKPGVSTCILDGEMLGFHTATKTFGTKAEKFDVKSKDLSDAGYQPCLYVFDVLLYNNKVLTNLPLQERITYIDKVVNEVEGRIVISRPKEARTNQDCADALNEAIDGQEEGIMVKNPDTVYRPNTRKGGWFKIKPEYIGGLMDELDVLIVGGYFGVGHRGGMMSHFLCAVAVPPEEGSEPEVFHSFCKVGSGYSKKQLSEFNKKMADHWQAFDKKNPPSCIILASGFKEKPDAWVEPSKSCIVQVRAAEIITSDRFKTGSTLRFPRVEMIRDDKSWFECMTVADIDDLKQKSGGKLTGARFELGEGSEPVKKKRKVVTRYERPKLAAQFRGVDVSSITQVSHMLEGKEFCVINGPSDFSKHDIEKHIIEFGGTVVQNPGNSTFCVLADKVAVRVNNLIKRNVYDIVKVDWFRRVFDAQRWIGWTPADMIHTSPGTLKKFKMDYDEYGDSFTEDTTEDQLQSAFSKMEQAEAEITGMEIAELEEKYFPGESPYGLFRICRMYIDNALVIGDQSTRIPDCSLDLLALELRFFGATLVSRLDEGVSHIIVDTKDLSRLDQFRKVRQQRKKKFHIVTEDWVRACMEEGSTVNERSYEPKHP